MVRRIDEVGEEFQISLETLICGLSPRLAKFVEKLYYQPEVKSFLSDDEYDERYLRARYREDG